jgi:hypothetical protein
MEYRYPMSETLKYPRTPHFSFSQQIYTDDHIIKTLGDLRGKEIIITIKYDGQGVMMTRDSLTGRSMYASHPCFQYCHDLHEKIRGKIPAGYKIAGENIQARQSLRYDRVPSLFLGFAVFDERNTVLSWDDTMWLFGELGITPVQVVHRGVFDENLLRVLAQKLDTQKHEGFVVRTTAEIPFGKFLTRVAKWVRKDHPLASVGHDWEPNVLAK